MTQCVASDIRVLGAKPDTRAALVASQKNSMIFLEAERQTWPRICKLPIMMKMLASISGLTCTLLVAGYAMFLSELHNGAEPDHLRSTVLSGEAWPTPWADLAGPSLSPQPIELGHWSWQLPNFEERSSDARRLRRQGLLAMENKRPCAAGMVLRRSFELEAWPRNIEERLEDLSAAYAGCGWLREAEDLARVSLRYFPTSYRAYVAERTLADLERGPTLHPMFERWQFEPLFRVLEARQASGDFKTIGDELHSWRRALARWASPNELARAEELALDSGASSLARVFSRVQSQRFKDSRHNFDWHQRSMRTSYRTLAQRAARRYNVPLALVMGVMRQESAFSSTAQSSAGALGLMQIMPLTGQYLARVPSGEPWDPAILLEPSVNVMLGVKYLSELQARFGDIELVLAAYNAGPTAVQRWLSKRPEDLVSFVESIPYDETRDYVTKVIAWMRRF